ncbi:MAG: GntR family transcriptional regulator [Planctomycetota bacterium]|nr:GntR family transcriptional regulator [Planctomycetota bacterium]
MPRGRREQIVQRLLADVIDGEFTAGEHLVTEDLARRYKVSHTPIREALSTLAGIGVIDLRPHRGAVVRRLAARDLIDLIQVRRVLECEAVRRACGRADPTQFTELAQELKKLAASKDSRGNRFVDQARLLDNRLHDLIATASGNALLAAELNRLKLLFRAVRDAAWQVEGTPLRQRLLEEAGEHLAIVEAVLANDSKAARVAMSKHIRAAVKYWLPIINSKTTSPPAPARGKTSTRTTT